MCTTSRAGPLHFPFFPSLRFECKYVQEVEENLDHEKEAQYLESRIIRSKCPRTVMIVESPY
jgi:hypothetical protein